MVLRIVADVAGDVLLLEPADTVLEAGSPRDRPGPRQRLGIALIGLEAFRPGPEADLELRQLLGLRDLPGLGAVSQVAVRQEEDWRHVLGRDPERLDGHPE